MFVGSLVAMLDGCCVGWLVRWLVRLIVRAFGVGWTVGRLVGWLVGGLVDVCRGWVFECSSANVTGVRVIE